MGDAVNAPAVAITDTLDECAALQCCMESHGICGEGMAPAKCAMLATLRVRAMAEPKELGEITGHGSQWKCCSCGALVGADNITEVEYATIEQSEKYLTFCDECIKQFEKNKKV